MQFELEKILDTHSTSAVQRLPAYSETTPQTFEFLDVPARCDYPDGKPTRSPDYTAPVRVFTDRGTREFEAAVPSRLAVQILDRGDDLIGVRLAYRSGELYVVKGL